MSKAKKLEKAKKLASDARYDAAIKFYEKQAQLGTAPITKVETTTVSTQELKLSREQVEAFLSLHGLDLNREDTIEVNVNSIDGKTLWQVHELSFRIKRVKHTKDTA